DRSSYIWIDHDVEQWGNRSDATLKTTFGGIRNEMVIGFDVNRIKFMNTNNSPYGGAATVPQEGFDPGFFLNENEFRPTTGTVTDQYSLFVDNRLELSEQWAVVGGVRYDHPDLERKTTRSGPGFSRELDSVNWR